VRRHRRAGTRPVNIADLLRRRRVKVIEAIPSHPAPDEALSVNATPAPPSMVSSLAAEAYAQTCHGAGVSAAYDSRRVVVSGQTPTSSAAAASRQQAILVYKMMSGVGWGARGIRSNCIGTPDDCS